VRIKRDWLVRLSKIAPLSGTGSHAAAPAGMLFLSRPWTAAPGCYGRRSPPHGYSLGIWPLDQGSRRMKGSLGNRGQSLTEADS
jgi:hypothetical protein